jgi:outer membrane protein assembly factor BamE (lipoprotein component of BamABCDE complex)
MLRRFRRVLAVSSCSVLLACSIPIEIGRSLDQQTIATVVPGMRVDQVIEKLGSPAMVGKNRQGERVWRYVYFKTDLPYEKGQKMTLQHVEVVIKAGQVVGVSYDTAE